jgi:serine/threonine-protein kinase HipA
MQSLGAMANLDFNMPRSNSYEQAFFTMRKLALPTAQVEELFGRMAFNIIARNQDDHVKNIAFLMGREGQWSLSPAFDMTLNYNPEGGWTNQHQMSLNGQRSDFTLADFDAGAKSALLNKRRARSIVSDVREAVSRWPEFAKQADIEKSRIKSINGLLRLNILI